MLPRPCPGPGPVPRMASGGGPVGACGVAFRTRPERSAGDSGVVARGVSWPMNTVRPSAVSWVWMNSRTGTRCPSRCSAGSGTDRPRMRGCPLSSSAENAVTWRFRRCSGMSTVRGCPTRSSGPWPSRSRGSVDGDDHVALVGDDGGNPAAAPARGPTAPVRRGWPPAPWGPPSRRWASAGGLAGDLVEQPVVEARLRGSAARSRPLHGRVLGRLQHVARVRTAGAASGGSASGRERISARAGCRRSAPVTPAVTALFMSCAVRRSSGGTPMSSPAARASPASRSRVCRCCCEAAERAGHVDQRHGRLGAGGRHGHVPSGGGRRRGAGRSSNQTVLDRSSVTTPCRCASSPTRASPCPVPA
ncbi:hypothetical protein SFUMM280S_06785 [Streptomyces fumanus]